MNTQILDMAGASVEHSMVIVNFVNMVYNQLKDSMCRVFPDNVQYKWQLDNGEEKIVVPDASINCQVRSRKGNSFINAPQFIMEVISPSTEKYDKEEKKGIYCEQEINEYWIVDWRKKQVDIYTLDYNEDKNPQYYLFKTISEENKDELKIVHFPNVKVTFDELFDFD